MYVGATYAIFAVAQGCFVAILLEESPSVQNALDKLREENFLWRSQRGSYSVGDEQFLEWLVEEDQDSNGAQ